MGYVGTTRPIGRRAPMARYAPAWVALCVGAAFVATTAFSYTLITLLGGLIAWLGALAFYLLLLCFLGWAVVHAATRIREDDPTVFLPAGIGVITLLCVVVIPLTDIGLATDFALNRAQREVVVAQVKAGALRPNVPYAPGLISLPFPYRHLSDGGEIEVIKDGRVLNIYFYTWRGVLDHYAAYIYRSDGADLAARVADGTIPPGIDSFSSLQRLDAHWFWGQHA